MKTHTKKTVLQYALLSITLFTPVVSLAAPLDGVKGLLTSFQTLLGYLEPLIFGLAFIYFFWGGAQFILHAGEPKMREEARNKMIWGIIVLFVMFSVVGILGWIGGTVGIPISSGSNTSNCGYLGNFENNNASC